MSPAQHFVNIKSIGVDESLLQKFPGYLEADMTHIGGRSEVLVGKFADVKGEFGSDMPVRALIIGHRRAESLLQLGKLDGGRRVDRLRMPQRVSQIVGQSSQSECIFIDRLRVPQKPRHEIAAAHVVSQITEKFFPEWVITHVLDR